MVSIASLWLPILVSAVLVFIASFLAWMVLPHHRGDWKKLPDEEAMRSAVKAQGAAPGQYTFPHAADPSQMKDPEWKHKAEDGPNGFLILRPPGMSMAKEMIIDFVYLLVIGVFVAYVAGHCLGPGAPYLEVFQIAGTVAILAYAGALPFGAIWFGRSWPSILLEMLDGVVYGLLTAGAFGWLWPAV